MKTFSVLISMNSTVGRVSNLLSVATMLDGKSQIEAELIAQRPKGLRKEFNLSTTRSVKQEDQLVEAQRRMLSSVCFVMRVMVISTRHEQGDVKIVDGASIVQMLHPKKSKNISGVH